MDPKVCGKLLTHHRRGSQVDVETLRERFPLRQITGEGPQMGSLWNRSFRWQKKVFHGIPWGFLIFLEFIVLELGQTELGGPHEAPGPTCPPGAPWWLVGPTKVFWPPLEASGILLAQEKISKKFHYIWTSFDIDFLWNKNRAENSNWHWALG